MKERKQNNRRDEEMKRKEKREAEDEEKRNESRFAKVDLHKNKPKFGQFCQILANLSKSSQKKERILAFLCR